MLDILLFLFPAPNPLSTSSNCSAPQEVSPRKPHAFGIPLPLISTWICPIRSLSRRREGGKSEIRVFSPYSLPGRLLWASCGPQWKITAPSRRHTPHNSLLLNSHYFSLSLSSQPRSGNGSAAACP